MGRSPGESDTGRAAGGSQEDVKGLGSSQFLVWDQWEIYQPLKSQNHILQQQSGPRSVFTSSEDPRGSQGSKRKAVLS